MKQFSRILKNLQEANYVQYKKLNRDIKLFKSMSMYGDWTVQIYDVSMMVELEHRTVQIYDVCMMGYFKSMGSSSYKELEINLNYAVLGLLTNTSRDYACCWMVEEFLSFPSKDDIETKQQVYSVWYVSKKFLYLFI